MVDVAGLGHPDRRVDEDVGTGFGGAPHRQLEMGAVHRVSRLECHHLGPSAAGELLSESGRRLSKLPEVIVDR